MWHKNCPDWQIYDPVSFSTHKQAASKWQVRPSKTWISLGIPPVWSESSLCTQWIAKDLEVSSCGQRRPGWSESSLGAHAILLVLSQDSSNCFCRCFQDYWCCKKKKGLSYNLFRKRHRIKFCLVILLCELGRILHPFKFNVNGIKMTDRSTCHTNSQSTSL